MEKNGGKLPPKERMVPMMAEAILFPAGLFWFAFTSSPNITLVPQVLAGIPIGFGSVMIFLQRTLLEHSYYRDEVLTRVRDNIYRRCLFDERKQRDCS